LYSMDKGLAGSQLERFCKALHFGGRFSFCCMQKA